MKTVGIITMHRVNNFGSVLQALALQESINTFGYDSSIIDYVYPEQVILTEKLTVKIKKAILWLCSICHIPGHRKSSRFKKFRAQNLVISGKDITYSSKSELNALRFDIFVTGSDQVWNPKYMGKHCAFLLDFVSEGYHKISYASSFATNEIAENEKTAYEKYLPKYKHIGVRESSSVSLVERYFSLKATHTCDPTLLLSKSDWEKYMIPVRGLPDKFILVYILTYAYNPFPEIRKAIDALKEQLHLPIVFIDGYKHFNVKNTDNILENDLGPGEFLYLFSKASYVITTSFHGTAFALNFRIPFVSLIRKRNNSDDRMEDFLKSIHAENHACVYNESPLHFPLEISSAVIDKLENFRSSSKLYLQSSLNENIHHSSSL